jgi:ribosomal protein L37E
MNVASMPCSQCGHPLTLHSRGICWMAKCKCRVSGITPAQAKVLKYDP